MNWMHSCKRVAELLTLSLDEPLGWLDRVRLKAHLSMCGNCRNVQDQLQRIEALSADLFSANTEFDEINLNAATAVKSGSPAPPTTAD